MEYLSHWFSKKYRIYEQKTEVQLKKYRIYKQQPTLSWRRMLAAENQIYNILHMFEPPLLNILQILSKVW